MKNMKIKVENNLDEIVGELERLGFRASQIRYDPKFINTTGHGYFLMTNHPLDFPLTTLAELKEM